MNFTQIENDILTNRKNKEYLRTVIADTKKIQEKYDWQMNKFLEKYIHGVEGLDKINEVDNSNPLYRYYKFKCDQYAQVTRIIRVAGAFL